LFLFSQFSLCSDIVDSPDVTLACTDDNYDLLLSESNYVYALFGCKCLSSIKTSEGLEVGKEQVHVIMGS